MALLPRQPVISLAANHQPKRWMLRCCGPAASNRQVLVEKSARSLRPAR